ncbi:MAG TPA: ATP-binding protein [Candidatus Thermoplasmatota archaeon]|nr:ATP-binding protein [Candidatus Thermoplasmatota archaeon]
MILGPLDDALGDKSNDERLPPGQRQRLELVQRNSVRLLKLVNTLLDFSRIEAGRTQPMREPTDLAVLTRELASVFESAMADAGLRFVVDAPALPQPVFVDRTMWEKIVLNLLSNALKFTLEGEVVVTLRSSDGEVELEVRDTGAGIPATEIPNMFTRFHRISGVQARSHEGSGIGLALVKELANLHGGTVHVASELGKGSTFKVRLPHGADTQQAREQLEPNTVDPIARRGAMPSVPEMFAQEASQWGSRTAGSPDSPVASPAVPHPAGPDPALAPRILVVEDNPDMASYIKGILTPLWTVEVAPDGLAALDTIRTNPPDLVLADVMMPRMDGLQLVQAIRANPAMAALPIILLSARASEEASVGGLEAGADDYLAKPFTTRSLVARVRVHLELARMRRERAEQQEQLQQMQRLKEMTRFKTQFINTAAHELVTPLTPLRIAARMIAKKNNDPAQAKNMALLTRNLDRLQRLVQDLLDASKLDAAKVAIKKSDVDISRTVSDVVELFKEVAQESGVGLQVRLDPHLLVQADPDRMFQIIQNLVSNAIKYSTAGGSVTVETRRGLEGGVQLEVRDTGIGIDPDFLPHMFTPFSRSHLKSDPIQAGTGLGLYITKGLVELHGATIHCRSEGPGKGTSFTVDFPG